MQTACCCAKSACCSFCLRVRLSFTAVAHSCWNFAQLFRVVLKEIEPKELQKHFGSLFLENIWENSKTYPPQTKQLFFKSLASLLLLLQSFLERATNDRVFLRELSYSSSVLVVRNSRVMLSSPFSSVPLQLGLSLDEKWLMRCLRIDLDLAASLVGPLARSLRGRVQL